MSNAYWHAPELSVGAFHDTSDLHMAGVQAISADPALAGVELKLASPDLTNIGKSYHVLGSIEPSMRARMILMVLHILAA